MKTSGLSESAVLDAARKAKTLKNGRYEAEITEAVERLSKRNSPMIELTVTVFGPDADTRIIKDYLTDAPFVAAKFRHLCEAVGVLQQYEAGEVEASDFVGHN